MGVKLDFKTNLRTPFGAYVQAEVVPSTESEKNTNTPRSVAAIALMPMMNGRGTNLFFNVNTNSEFRADRWRIFRESRLHLMALGGPSDCQSDK
jgi:hypothetical protein